MKSESETLVQLLCPYGNWEHKNGMQIVDKTAAKKIRDTFMKGFDRVWGLPIYVGHPDEGYKSHKAKSIGRIESISVLGEGLAISARYTDEAYKNLTNGRLKWLSPRWRMEKLKDGTFRPVKLISVGMTNNPNIPGSGTILSSNEGLKKDFIGRILSANDTCAALKKTAAKTSAAVAAIKTESERLRKEQLDQNLKNASEKPQPHELAKMALDRSDKTGESYLESFTALRRKYYGKNKFGAHERSSNQRNK